MTARSRSTRCPCSALASLHDSVLEDLGIVVDVFSEVVNECVTVVASICANLLGCQRDFNTVLRHSPAENVEDVVSRRGSTELGSILVI